MVWTYSGVRPLYNDGATSATAATRDYVLSLDQNGAPLLNVFGGKITTYRRLAESALAKLAPFFPHAKPAWTARVPLPGGDFPHTDVAKLTADLAKSYPFLTPLLGRPPDPRLRVRGRNPARPAKTAADLGQDFGATLTEAEVRWLITHEFAREANDIVWRRTKLGLRMNAEQISQLSAYMAATVTPRAISPAAE